MTPRFASILSWCVTAVALTASESAGFALPPPGLREVPVSRKPDKSRHRRKSPSRQDRLLKHRATGLKLRIAHLKALLPTLKAELSALGAESTKVLALQTATGRRLKRTLAQYRRITRKNAVSTLATLSRYTGPDIQVDAFRSAAQRRSAPDPAATPVDGDSFFIHMSVSVPRQMAAVRTPMRFAWRIKGVDNAGHEVTLAERTLFSGRFVRVAHEQAVLHSHVRGIGLTPGIYSVKASMEVQGRPFLKRTRYQTFRVTRGPRLVTAAPLKRFRVTRNDSVVVTRAALATPGARRMRRSDFVIHVGYRIADRHFKPGMLSVVGAYVAAESASTRAEEPLLTLFRHWDRPRKGHNTFGGGQLTRVRGLDRTLKPGRYKIRVYAAVSNQRVTVWSFRDVPFTVDAKGGK